MKKLLNKDTGTANEESRMRSSYDNVALIVIYNHHYPDNVDRVERLYSGRFSHVYHLMPFYKGQKPNVIPVYEHSYYFQGFITQGFTKYFKEEYSHYAFIADDIVLNPCIDETNIFSYFKLDDSNCYIPGLIQMDKPDIAWPRVREAYEWKVNIPGLEISSQLPDYQSALRILENRNLKSVPLRFQQLWNVTKSPKKLRRAMLYEKRLILKYLITKLKNEDYHLPYPLVGSYSDIFIVNSDSIRQFSHFCGVFAASKLFVELAIPTSLAFSAGHIVTNQDLDYRGMELWSKKDLSILKEYGSSLKNLIEKFPQDCLYIHPVKLSQWKFDI